MRDPAAAHGGKDALRSLGHFPVRQFSPKNIFFGNLRMTLAVAAGNGATFHRQSKQACQSMDAARPLQYVWR
jgi:hypothetical protein